VEIPKIVADLGSQLYFVKFFNFLGVEPRPLDTDTYEHEVSDENFLTRVEVGWNCGWRIRFGGLAPNAWIMMIGTIYQLANLPINEFEPTYTYLNA